MSLIAELKRRNVFRVAAAYGILSWLLLQVGDLLFDLMGLPDWALRIVLGILILGFPVAVVFSWVYELTPEGLRKESDIPAERSITAHTGRRLDYITIGMIVLGIAFVTVDRFVLEPKPSATPEQAEQPAAAPAVAAGSEAQAPRADRSIAVLPFVNMSTDPENEFFADGLSEEILNRLAQVPQLRVIGRTSSFSFKGDDRDLREIGRLLDAGNILEGSVRRQGNQVRITAQLIASADGAHLWSQTYDRTLEDVFAIQDDIAQRVVQALDIVLDEKARAAMMAAGIRNVEAFVAYQRGLKLHQEAHGEKPLLATLEEGNQLLDRATDLAPEFAAAYLAKADYFAHQLLETGVPLEQQETALVSIREVLRAAQEAARDPQRKAAIEIDRILFSDDWSDLPRALDEYLAEPGCESANWVELAVTLADPGLFVDHWRMQIECNPLFFHPYMALANTHIQRRDLDAADAVLQQGIETVGRHRFLIYTQIVVTLARGEAERALEQLDRVADSMPDNEAATLRLAALALLGRIEEARSYLAESQNGTISEGWSVTAMANFGEREAANAAAAALEAEPAGPLSLLRSAHECYCGAPFDLEATPNFRGRIQETGLQWPPPTILEFPSKDW